MRVSQIPEYRQRSKENAERRERDNRDAEAEAKARDHIAQITAVIERVERELNRVNDEHTPQKNRDRVWERLGTAGLWAAAGVGLIAIFVASSDAERQRGVMQGQLNEMKSQRLVTIAQTRASLRRDTSVHAVTEGRKVANPGETVVGYEISPVWKNSGSTSAIDYRGWFDIQMFDIGPVIPRKLGAKDCPQSVVPNPLPDGRVVLNGDGVVQLAKFVSVEDATAQMGDRATKFILMWGHAEYRDIYFPETPPHFDDWCVSVAPNNLQQALFSFIVLSEKVN